MNITEHEMRGLLTGKCVPGDMLVNEALPSYLVRKFAELKAQRDALAAEVHNCRGFVADHLGPEAELQFSGLNTDFADSILNSVRADGVDDLATFAGEQYQQHVGDKTQQKKWKSIVFLCTQFATQLRAGKGGA